MIHFKAKNIQKNWPDFSLNFSCEIEKGTMLGIVGHSGSGKSTVLRLISGLIPLNSQDSSIIMGEKELIAVHPSKRNIGMVFQTPCLFNHMKVVDNVAYGLISRGIKKKEAQKHASEFLQQFGLEGFDKRWPDSLSGGEAQRVSLARTLITKPDLVLFDEPFSALDAPLRKKLATDIKQLQSTLGFTGIMVTHDITEAQNLCDIVTVMQKGKQTWTGNAKEFSEEKLVERSHDIL